MINTKMKFWYPFFLFAVIWVSSSDSLFGQRKIKVENSNDYIELSGNLERKFKRDAARLALRLKEENGHGLKYEDIIIPLDTIENLYNVLTQLYVNSELVRKITKNNIHTNSDPSTRYFMLIFDREIDWAKYLREGIAEIDNMDIDSLLLKYDLIIDDHLQWNDSLDVIKIRSGMHLNMAALSNEFYNFEGVVEIDLGIPDIEGNDIQVEQVNGMWEVTYILAYDYSTDMGKKTYVEI